MIFLQAGGGAIVQMLPLLLIFVVFYFFMIRPQMKRQKDQQSFADALEKGRDVVTASGIIGKINKIDGNIVTLQVSQNVFIRVTKGSISKEMTEAFSSSLTTSES
jgi:preprotein translocase subunit YajC